MRTIQFIQSGKPKGKTVRRRYDEYDTTIAQVSEILFSEREVALIKKRFDKMANSEKVNYESFRDSLGILGMAHATFLSERLFRVIAKGSVHFGFEDFLHFLNVLVNGTQLQKAQLSFRFLDVRHEGKLLHKDIEQLCSDVLLFWHFMTGTKVLPNRRKIDQLVRSLDVQNTGEINFEAYLKAYTSITDILNWFEFFNEPSASVEGDEGPTLCQLRLNKALETLEDTVYECMVQLKHCSRLDGPLWLAKQASQKEGDMDPGEESTLNRQIYSLSQKTVQNHEHQLLNYLDQQFENLVVLIKNNSLPRMELNRQVNHSNDYRRATVANLQKKKQPVYFGHENWNLILNMMIGMRISVRSLQPIQVALVASDFKSKYVHDVITQRSSNQVYMYKFTDYAPQVFNEIRRHFGITNYVHSVGPENLLGNLILGKLSSLSELSSSGKSGSFFYFTDDSKYMIKTISKHEYELLRGILESYYHYVSQNRNTLLSQILGLHRMQISKGRSKKIYIIVIANLFSTTLTIDVRYDLKGSTYGRRTRQDGVIVDKNTALKDLDFLDDKIKILVDQSKKDALIRQIRSDVAYLGSNHIIDYSLLVGIHFRRAFEANKNDHGVLSEDGKAVFFIGIIDILTGYNLTKQLEYSMKSTFVDSNVSCVPPIDYAERFLRFMIKQAFA